MNNVADLLRDADPLRHESPRIAEERDRLRHAVVAAARGAVPPPSMWFRRSIAVLATAAVAIAIVALGSRSWLQGGAMLQAAVRFEVRLAEDGPAPGLRESRISGSDRVVYLHQEIIVTNSDVAQSRLVQVDGAPRFSVGVEFNAAGAQKMRQATASHIGKPVAILIDGEVVMAPVLRGPITTSAVISGDYARAEAERIVAGIGVP